MIHPQPRDREAEVAKKVADDLERRIEAGEWPPGVKLPTDVEVAKQYEVSEHLASRAYDRLKKKRLITRRRGSGTYVQEPEKALRVVSNRRYLDAVSRTNRRPPERQVIDPGGLRATGTYLRIPAPPGIAASLSIPEGAQVLHCDIQYWANDRLDELSESYIPADRVAGTDAELLDREPWPGGIVEQLAAANIEVFDIAEQVHTRLATDAEAKSFKIPYDSSLFVITRQTYDEHGLVEIGTMLRSELDTKLEYITTVRHRPTSPDGCNAKKANRS